MHFDPLKNCFPITEAKIRMTGYLPKAVDLDAQRYNLYAPSLQHSCLRCQRNFKCRGKQFALLWRLNKRNIRIIYQNSSVISLSFRLRRLRTT